MMVNVARRTVLRLGVLAVSALGVGGAIAGTRDSRTASGTPAKYPDKEQERLWRYAGEFGGSKSGHQVTKEE